MRFLLILLAAGLAHARTVRDVPYVGNAGPRQTLDLHLPQGQALHARPVVIAIHGGGWTVGDKAEQGFLQPKTRWLMRHGFIVASINYRLSPQARHPAHVDDVRAAIAWVTRHIGKYGGDPHRLYLLGHSAGAHLAALAAVDAPRLEAAGIDPGWISGVVLIDGAGYDIPRQLREDRINPQIDRMINDAFTGSRRLQLDASPVYRIHGGPPPFLILHETLRPGFARQAKRLEAALRRHGGRVTRIPVPGKNHLTISRHLGRPRDPLTRVVTTFLTNTPRNP
jgi:acetyl esterase/lipase